MHSRTALSQGKSLRIRKSFGKIVTNAITRQFVDHLQHVMCQHFTKLQHFVLVSFSSFADYSEKYCNNYAQVLYVNRNSEQVKGFFLIPKQSLS